MNVFSINYNKNIKQSTRWASPTTQLNLVFPHSETIPSVQLSTFWFTLDQNGHVLSFRNVQQVQDSIFPQHSSEVRVVHLEHRRRRYYYVCVESKSCTNNISLSIQSI